ncbi:MAG: hypothetical protein LBL28_00135 [Treponema sp.]|jgi:hypothetical protein|nr:hypothetical protein [Treponema sp.]
MNILSIKKIIVSIAFILLGFAGTINAEEYSNFSWEFADYGFGLNFSPNRNNLEFSAGLFNIFFDNYKTNMGVKLSPFNIRTNIEAKESEETNSITELNFVNLCVYWNCLDGADMILGPFASIQYVNIRNWEMFDYRNITINAGIKYLYRTKYVEKIDGNFFVMEYDCGYRYNYHDGHKFYISISADLISTFVMIGNIGRWLNS